ncbi:AXIN1 up-regulated 1 isoform X2 [Ptiloglossa arizonensis]
MESPSARERPFEAQEDSTSVESPGTVVAVAVAAAVVTTAAATAAATPIESTEVASDASTAAVDTRDVVDGQLLALGSPGALGAERARETQPDPQMGQKSRKSCKQSDDGDETDEKRSIDVDPSVRFLEKEDLRSVGSSPVSRKRPASDFLPISAEIKRIGVEIPENEANQLRSDVRRISPVLVSLRERTLGEISLSSDSCLFEDEGRCISRNARILESTFTSPCRPKTLYENNPEGSNATRAESSATTDEDTTLRAGGGYVASISPKIVEQRAENATDYHGSLEYTNDDAFIDEDSCCSLARESPEREHHPCQEKQCEEPAGSCACDDSVLMDDVLGAKQSNEESIMETRYLSVTLQRIDMSGRLTPERKDKKRPTPKKKLKKNLDDADVNDTDREETLGESPVQRCPQETKNLQTNEPEDLQHRQVSPVANRSKTSSIETQSSPLGAIKNCKVMLSRVSSPKPVRTTKDVSRIGATNTEENLEVDPTMLSAENSQSSSNTDQYATIDSQEETKLSVLEHEDASESLLPRCVVPEDNQKIEFEDRSNEVDSNETPGPRTSLDDARTLPSGSNVDCKMMMDKMLLKPVRTPMEIPENEQDLSLGVSKNPTVVEEATFASSSAEDPLKSLDSIEARQKETESFVERNDPAQESFVQRCANENIEKTESEDYKKLRAGLPVSPRSRTPSVEAQSSSPSVVKNCKVLLERVASPKLTRTTPEKSSKDETTSRVVIKKLVDEEVALDASLNALENPQPLNNKDSSKVEVDASDETKPSADQKDSTKESRSIQHCAHENVEKIESEERRSKKLGNSPVMIARPRTLSGEGQSSSSPSSPSSSGMKDCKVVLARMMSPKPVKTAVEKLTKNDTASRAVIKNLRENEEVVYTSSSHVTENLQPLNNLVSSETTPTSPVETLEPTVDVPEAVDTETETETGSDSSEVSMTNVRLRSCDDDAVSDQISCPESESMCCVDINPEIITRLEAERPEAFTEDSAESLALATGARDEVRSDGSDSGLGSEIPGDPGPAPAPESDSETSFLDRIPDDILSDKEKAVNQLESFTPTVATPGTPQTPLAAFPSPSKSNLKRRLTDCMEGAPTPKRSNTDESMKKKRNIQFDAVTVYYFPRAQGFTCVPSQGGSTLGMSATHTHAERFSLSEHAAEQRRIHRARLAQLRSERAANCVVEAASSSEDPSDDTDEEQSDNEELDIDSYYFLQPVPTWQRRALLRAAGVRRIDAVEKDECRDIRASREHCGCGCKGYCDPESCPCSRANVKCQVDRAGFPCGCTRDGCANSSGRIEFNPVRVRTHFIHTLMRLELEKKQREEEGTDHDASDNQNGRSPLREINLGSVIENRNGESCLNGGGFTTLHYENHDAGDGGGNCQPEVPGTREDSLDLYAIRDDCYPSEDTVDGTQGPQRKLHPEFSQAFQTFSGQTNAGVNFQQPTYQDYQPYANLPSTSRVQFQPQFQAVPGNSGFSHYAPYGQETGSIPGNCQVHPGQHSSTYETSFAQDETTGSQYTNLNSVQPMNAVQQMGKLEPFSELLSGRYSYYGEMEPQAHGTYHGNGTKVEVEKSQGNEQQSESTEECDENFGEIIKKSMVETVSA